MPKNKFVGPEDDGIAVPEEVKVERTGTKKLKVASASDEDIKKAPKPTVVSDRSSWSETNKLDFEVSKMAGLSDAEAEMKINKKREKLSGPSKVSRPSANVRPVESNSKGSAKSDGGSSKPSSGYGNPVRKGSSGGGTASPAVSPPSGVSKSTPPKLDQRPRGRVGPSVPLEKPKPSAKVGPPEKSSGRNFVGPKAPAPVSKSNKSVKDSSPINFEGPKKKKPSYVVNEENKIRGELRQATQPRSVPVSEEDARSARWKAKYEKPMTEQAKSVGKVMSTPLPGALGNPMKAAFGPKKKKATKKRPSSSGNRTRRGMD